MSLNKQKAVEELIAYTLIDNKPELIAILRKNGVSIGDDASDEKVLIAVLKGNSVSKSFKSDLTQLLSKQAMQNADRFVSFTGEENFFNVDGDRATQDVLGTVSSTRTSTSSTSSGTKSGGKTKAGTLLAGVGGFIKNNVFTSDNINQFISTGLTAVSNKSQSKADAAAAQVEALKAQRLQLEQSLSPKKSTNTLTYVLIGVGVLAIGLSVYFYVKRK
jgi:hypothetical protein